MKKIFKNKKGVTFQAFLEVMLMSVLFVGILAIIGLNMNRIYNDDKDLSFGILSDNTLEQLKSTRDSLDEAATKKGQSLFSSLGFFTISTLPNMIMTMLSLVKDFILGNWIRSLIELMNLGEYTNLVATIFQLLYFFLLIFIIIKIIVRSNV